jgi:hypothetical protein
VSRVMNGDGGTKPDRTKAMIALYRSGWTMRRIGSRYRLSHERVRQILWAQAPRIIRPKNWVGRGS